MQTGQNTQTQDQKNPQLIKALADAIVSNPRATLLELAELARVSKATLHRVFGTREELIDAIYIESKNTVLQMIQEFERLAHFESADSQNAAVPNESGTIKDNNPSYLAFKTLITLHVEHSVMLRFLCVNPTMAQDEHFVEYLKTLQQFFLRGQKQGLFKIEFSASVLTEIFISMMFGTIESAGRERIAKAEVADIVEQFFLFGAVEPNYQSG